MRLLAVTARNGAASALAAEGGLESTRWAGPEVVGRASRESRQPVQGTLRRAPLALRVGIAGDEFGYALDLGLPAMSPTMTAFSRDPEIKREAIWAGPVLRPATLLTERAGGSVRTRGDEGEWSVITDTLAPYDSMLSEVADPQRTLEVVTIRERMRPGGSTTPSAPTPPLPPAPVRWEPARRCWPGTALTLPPRSRPSRRSGTRLPCTPP